MIINLAGLSTLAEKIYTKNGFQKPGELFLTEEEWKKIIERKRKTTNYQSTDYGDEIFWKSITLNCLDLMDHVGSYWVGEFDCHNEEHLEEIWDTLIRGWYFSKIWIIKSEKVMDLEIKLAENELYRNDIQEDKLLRGNPFRLFTGYSIKEEKKGEIKYYFKSLLTGIENFDLDPKEMICLTLNDGANFRKWWKINIEYLAGKSRVIDALKAISKTVQVIVRNKEAFKKELSQLDNPSIMYRLNRQAGTIGAKEQNIYQEMPLIDSQRVKDMKEIVQSMYDKDCELMGYTVNANDKKERLTVAEDYKDMRQITNLQDQQLKNLKIFEKKLKERGWVKENFKIEISGLTFAQGLPDTVTPDGQIIDNPENNNNNNQWKQPEPS